MLHCLVGPSGARSAVGQPQGLGFMQTLSAGQKQVYIDKMVIKLHLRSDNENNDAL